MGPSLSMSYMTHHNVQTISRVLSTLERRVEDLMQSEAFMKLGGHKALWLNQPRNKARMTHRDCSGDL